jgi:hypothetical protein
MNQTWPMQLLEELEILDVKEVPHGLYGIRRAYVPEGQLPTMAHVLASPRKVGFLRKCGFSGGSTDQRSDTLYFTSGIDEVSLQVLDYATTKVRHYGSAFRLDKRHVKQSREPAWDLLTLVARLGIDRYGTQALLLIAHFVSTREIEGVLGKPTDPAFLDRYRLAHYLLEWDDRYGRGFRTAPHLWVPRSDGYRGDEASNNR